MYYEFVFENNTAIIRVVSTGKIVVSQPFNPSGIESRPWASAEEARAWAEDNHGSFLVADTSLEPSDAPAEESTESSDSQETIPAEPEMVSEEAAPESSESLDQTAGQGE